MVLSSIQYVFDTNISRMGAIEPSPPDPKSKAFIIRTPLLSELYHLESLYSGGTSYKTVHIIILFEKTWIRMPEQKNLTKTEVWTFLEWENFKWKFIQVPFLFISSLVGAILFVALEKKCSSTRHFIFIFLNYWSVHTKSICVKKLWKQ